MSLNRLPQLPRRKMFGVKEVDADSDVSLALDPILL